MSSEAETTGESREATELARFLASYGTSERPQDPLAAVVDPQLKSIAVTLSDRIAASAEGTIVDLGCGQGVLLRRLAELDAFRMTPGWFYVAADYDERLTDVLKLAADIRFHRRVDVVPLSELYDRWLAGTSLPQPLIVVVRNVLHELDVVATAVLFEALAKHLDSNDFLIIQDLQVFPHAERGNACWQPQILRAAIESCGIAMEVLVEETTSRGNRWFTMTGARMTAPAQAVLDIIARARRDQYDLWLKADALVSEDAERRHHKVAMLDLDLQLAALHRQLTLAAPGAQAPPAPRGERDIAALAIQAQFEAFDAESISRSPVSPGRVEHFRNRANSQDALEQFLLGDAALTIVRGGPYSGKSVLVAEVLARRAHDRQPVILDAQSSSSVWNLLEQLLTGISLPFSYRLIQESRGLELAGVSQYLRRLLNQCARRTVVVLDHVERLLDPNRVIEDPEIREFISSIASAPGAKMILTTRDAPDLSFLPPAVTVDHTQPPVGRFPEGKHVENVLDDFIARDAIGLAAYPPELIEAIDRHPFLAVLAARVIEAEGAAAIDDPSFLELVRHRLRGELARRIISETARPAVDLLGRLRIPIPRAMFDGLAGRESVEEALRLGVLYPVFDRLHSDLLTGLAVLRATPRESLDDLNADEERELDRDENTRIADWYGRLYRESDDPRWLREIYFHAMAAGGSAAIHSLGAAYRYEIFAAGEYWFRRTKDFPSALWAFERARELGIVTYFSELRLASCQVRAGRRPEGEEKYGYLLAAYPSAHGVKTSYIDSLLFVRDFEGALSLLERFGISVGDDAWTDHEFGRAFLGLHRYQAAVRAFESQLKKQADALAFLRLAQAYHRCGERDQVDRVLRAGLRRAPRDRALNVSYAAHLIRSGDSESREEAEEVLCKLESRFPFDGAVIQQLCKVLGLTGRAQEALKLLESKARRIRPERYVLLARAEALIASGRYRDCIRELGNVPSDNEHLVGLKKKAFLWWATTEPEPGRRRALATEGLSVPHDARLQNNIPLAVTSVRLARLADDAQLYDRALRHLRSLNPGVAELISESEESSYWDDEAFD
jgi:tetratricopeptide (TPR) repeat protein